MDSSLRGMVSIVYENIQRIASPSLNRIKRQWEELGTEISDSAWQWAIKLVHSSSACIRHGLLQFKVLHRLHLSRSKLAKIYTGSDATCPRCSLEPADLSHMFWGCPRLIKFWTDIFSTFSFVCHKNIDPIPLTAIFEVVPEETQLSANQIELIAFSTLLARRLILLSWKKTTPPSH